MKRMLLIVLILALAAPAVHAQRVGRFRELWVGDGPGDTLDAHIDEDGAADFQSVEANSYTVGGVPFVGGATGTTNNSTQRYNSGTSAWQEETDFLVDTSGNATAKGGTVDAGVANTTPGKLYLRGGLLTDGGEILIYNGASAAASTAYWRLYCNTSGQIALSGNGGSAALGDVFTFDDASGAASFAKGPVKIKAGSMGFDYGDLMVEDLLTLGGSSNIAGNLYYNAAWKYYSNNAGWLLLDDNTNGGLRIDTAPVNAGGAGAAASPGARLYINGTSVRTVAPFDADGTLNADGNATFNANSTFGDTSTDYVYVNGRWQPRSVTDAGPMTATAGTQKEILWNTSDSRWWGATTTSVSASTWEKFAFFRDIPDGLFSTLVLDLPTERTCSTDAEIQVTGTGVVVATVQTNRPNEIIVEFEAMVTEMDLGTVRIVLSTVSGSSTTLATDLELISSLWSNAGTLEPLLTDIPRVLQNLSYEKFRMHFRLTRMTPGTAVYFNAFISGNTITPATGKIRNIKVYTN